MKLPAAGVKAKHQEQVISEGSSGHLRVAGSPALPTPPVSRESCSTGVMTPLSPGWWGAEGKTGVTGGIPGQKGILCLSSLCVGGA